MLRFVASCEPAMSNQSFVLARLTELDCAYHPKHDPGQENVKLFPLKL
jgi:hypothetical protein